MLMVMCHMKVYIKMKYSAQSDVGKKYQHNEDYFILPESNSKYNLNSIDIEQKGHLFVLCDGMGGANAGEVASELTANWLSREYYTLPKISSDYKSELERIVRNINLKIFNLASEHQQYQGMGTTLIAALFLKKAVYICSVGDSRAYLFRDNELSQLTDDQSEVWELYKAGAITKDEIRQHPRNNIITAAIGVEKDVSINTYKQKVFKEDIFLICSDGLTDVVSDNEIMHVLCLSKSLKKMISILIDLVNKYGGKDNITIILVKV